MTTILPLDQRPIDVLPLARIATMTGLEVLRGMLVGDLPAPPFSATTRIYPIEVEEGRIVFEGEPKPAFLNPLGTVHGGWISTILDSAMACAVHSKLPAGKAYTTVEMKVNFVRAVLPRHARVRCEARVRHFGGRIATADGELVDAATGTLLAHGSETCLIFDAG